MNEKTILEDPDSKMEVGPPSMPVEIQAAPVELNRQKESDGTPFKTVNSNYNKTEQSSKKYDLAQETQQLFGIQNETAR